MESQPQNREFRKNFHQLADDKYEKLPSMQRVEAHL